MADEPMSDERLAEIRARTAAATPGSWAALGGSIVRAENDTDEVVDWVSHNDADVVFIANAREDIPALLTEVDRLRTREAAAMGIVRDVAAIRESGTGYASIDAQPYDVQISALTITRARAPLDQE